MLKKEMSISVGNIKCSAQNSRYAFTLAEVLITLCVIGVVAALTLPSLINSYKEKIYSTQIQKTYSILADAAKQVVIDENATQDILESTTSGETAAPGFYTSDAGLKDSSATTGAEYFLSKYIKNNKKGQSPSGIMADSYTTPDGTNSGTVPSDVYCVRTPAGAGICMKYDTSANVAKLYVDSNGIDDPNEYGVDLFVMKINNDSSISDIVEENGKCNVASTGANTLEKYAGGCLYKVMKAGWKVEE